LNFPSTTKLSLLVLIFFLTSQIFTTSLPFHYHDFNFQQDEIKSKADFAVKNIRESQQYPHISTTLNDNEVICRIEFADLKIDANHKILSEGCSTLYESGKPALPVKTFSILLPPHMTIKSITLLELDKRELEGKYKVKLTSLPSNVFKNSSKSTLQEVSSDFYPQQCIAVNGVYGFRGYRLVNVACFAAQYNLFEEKLIQIKKVKFSLELEKDNFYNIESFFRGSQLDADIVKDLVVNSNDISFYIKFFSPIRVNSTYKYVVITSSAFEEAFQPLIDWKTQKLGSAVTVTISEINSQYSGIDLQEKIRNFIKYAYQYWNTEWILLGGDIEIIPYRGVYGEVDTVDGLIVDTYIPCDLYYSCLDGDWNADGDLIYGEVTDLVDFYPEVYIGRAPVSTVSEATTFVNKVLTYERNPPPNYRSKALLIAYWLDDSTNGGIAKDNIAESYLTDYLVTRNYEPYYKAGISKNEVIEELNNGYGIVNHNSHGNYWTTPPLYSYDVDTLSNGEKYFVFYSTACLTNAFNETDAISEHYILNPNGGAVAYIGNSAYGWYSPGEPGGGPSDNYDMEFFRTLFLGYTHIGEALARSKMSFISSSTSNGAYRWIQFCLNLLGDPEMNIIAKEFHLNCRVLDWNGDVVSNASVYVNGNFYGFSDNDGWVNSTSIWSGLLKLETYWMGTKVNETSIILEDDLTLFIYSHIWDLQLNTLDAESNCLLSTIIHVVFPNSTSKQLPPGTYKVSNGSYWFAVIWQNSLVYENTSMLLDVSDTVLNLRCDVYLISFLDSFKDIYGRPLYPLPSSFQLLLPNGTISLPLDPHVSYLIQSGTTIWVSIIWQGMEIAPPNTSFNAKNGNPIVYCEIDLSEIPESPFWSFLCFSISLFILQYILRRKACKIAKNKLP
jgi:hypothetical protein